LQTIGWLASSSWHEGASLPTTSSRCAASPSQADARFVVPAVPAGTNVLSLGNTTAPEGCAALDVLDPGPLSAVDPNATLLAIAESATVHPGESFRVVPAAVVERICSDRSTLDRDVAPGEYVTLGWLTGGNWQPLGGPFPTWNGCATHRRPVLLLPGGPVLRPASV
jgi:hypothetical protein